MTKDSPVKGGSNPVGISKYRASQSAVGTAKERPSSKVDMKEKISTSRASQSAVGTAKERPSSKLNMKEKSSTSRASQSAVGTAKERPSSKLDKKEKVVLLEHHSLLLELLKKDHLLN